MSARRVLQEFIMEPGTGKAVEVRKGQILRIAQTEGGQCADFNCLNLHDDKEFLTPSNPSYAPTAPPKDDFPWSAPPREGHPPPLPGPGASRS